MHKEGQTSALVQELTVLVKKLKIKEQKLQRKYNFLEEDRQVVRFRFSFVFLINIFIEICCWINWSEYVRKVGATTRFQTSKEGKRRSEK